MKMGDLKERLKKGLKRLDKILGRGQEMQNYTFVIPLSSIKEPIWYPFYIKEGKKLTWFSLSPTKNGKIRGIPLPFGEGGFTPLYPDLKKPQLNFTIGMSVEDKENFVKLANKISEECKVPLYTFRCFNCHKLYVLLPNEFWPTFKMKNGKINLVYECRRCLLEKGQTMAWGRPLIEDWEWKF